MSFGRKMESTSHSGNLDILAHTSHTNRAPDSKCVDPSESDSKYVRNTQRMHAYPNPQNGRI
jgi:hypothetical protein